MLIAVIGPPKAGKDVLATHLVLDHGFTRVHISAHRPAAASGQDALHFTSSSAFLEHATKSWRRDYVTTDLQSRLKLQEFAKRPFVAIVAVEAPLGVRFTRAVQDAKKASSTSLPTLDSFVAADDLRLHGPLPGSLLVPSPIAPCRVPTPPPGHLLPTSNGPPSPSPSPARSPAALLVDADPLDYWEDPLSTVLPLALVTLSNAHDTPQPFLDSLSLTDLAARLRPPWDTYFMLLASLASLRSNCMKRRVGAVLVREKRVVSTGYNGTPRGVKNCGEGGCARCNSGGDGLGGQVDGDVSAVVRAMGEGLNECLCLHAEENALLEAGRERVSGGGTEGAVLYCNTCPCLRCTVKIVQCGVTEVVYSLSYSMDTASRRVMEEAGVVLRQMDPPSLLL